MPASLAWTTRLLFVLPLPVFGFAFGFLIAELAVDTGLSGTLVPAGGFLSGLFLLIAGVRYLLKPPSVDGPNGGSWSELARCVLGAGAIAFVSALIAGWVVVLRLKLTGWGEEGEVVLFVAQLLALSGAGPLGVLSFWRRLARTSTLRPASSAAPA